MLETEAKKKVCPYKLNNSAMGRLCEGTHCMGWEVLFEKKDDEWVPRNPSQGYCAMVPPEPRRAPAWKRPA